MMIIIAQKVDIMTINKEKTKMVIYQYLHRWQNQQSIA